MYSIRNHLCSGLSDDSTVHNRELAFAIKERNWEGRPCGIGKFRFLSTSIVVKFYDVASCSIASTVLRTSDITVCLLRTGAVPRCFGSCAFTNNN